MDVAVDDASLVQPCVRIKHRQYELAHLLMARVATAPQTACRRLRGYAMLPQRREEHTVLLDSPRQQCRRGPASENLQNRGFAFQLPRDERACTGAQNLQCH